jgi:hypothetical protein
MTVQQVGINLEWMGLGKPVCEALVTDGEGNVAKIGEVHLIDLNAERGGPQKIGWLVKFSPTGEIWTAKNRGQAEEGLLDALWEMANPPTVEEAVANMEAEGLQPEVVSSPDIG